MRLKLWIYHLLWLAICSKDWILFHLSCLMTHKVQERLLRAMLYQNKDTCYGKAHHFPVVRSIEEYQRVVPISIYEDYMKHLDMIMQGQRQVLTEEDVDILEPTSGSTSASKFIPYTRGLKRQFLLGIHPWIFDLLCRNPSMRGGSAYWSITPWVDSTECGKHVSQVPIGFKSDGEYFSSMEQKIISETLAVPIEVAGLKSLANFQYATVLFLLRAGSLSFISVWSPTFLLVLLNTIPEWFETLVHDIAKGMISFPEPAEHVLSDTIMKKCIPDQKRARFIEQRWKDVVKGGNYGALWSKLSVISCWGSGNSRMYLSQLSRMFSGVRIEPKGLMATEAVISFPFGKAGESLLAIRSHFFEFEKKNGDTDEMFLAHQLSVGEKYSVIVTTAGGLYRYRMNDIVEIKRFHGNCPVVEFIGRGASVIDLVGEKLNEEHVEMTVKAILSEHNISPTFLMVAPEQTEDGTLYYVLFLECDKNSDSTFLTTCLNIKKSIDIRLRENFHYDYCRNIGQLLEPQIFSIMKGGQGDYLLGCCSVGQKLGDIKPMLFRKEFGWSSRFHGYFVNL